MDDFSLDSALFTEPEDYYKAPEPEQVINYDDFKLKLLGSHPLWGKLISISFCN